MKADKNNFQMTPYTSHYLILKAVLGPFLTIFADKSQILKGVRRSLLLEGCLLLKCFVRGFLMKYYQNETLPQNGTSKTGSLLNRVP